MRELRHCKSRALIEKDRASFAEIPQKYRRNTNIDSKFLQWNRIEGEGYAEGYKAACLRGNVP